MSPEIQGGGVSIDAVLVDGSGQLNGLEEFLRVDSCTFRGSLVALRIRDGKLVWKTYTIPEPAETGKNAAGNSKWGPSGASIWSAPTIDAKRNLIYVTTGDNFSSPATLTSDAVLALDPATGRIVLVQADDGR